jgi:hypothetical protein
MKQNLRFSRRALRTTSSICLWFGAIGCGAEERKSDAGSGPDGGEHRDVSSTDSAGASDTAGPPDSLDTTTFCVRSSQCYVFPDDCCQTDCTAIVPVPMNGAGRREYFQFCSARNCMACVIGPETVPLCIDNRCSFVDLGSSSLSACRADQDCTLRWGTGCCWPCQPTRATDLVAVARTAEFCAPEDRCDPCGIPPFPDGASAVCIEGRCRVQR